MIAHSKVCPWLVALFAVVAAPSGVVRGAVSVVAHRGAEPLRLTVSADGQAPWSLNLEPGDSRPIFAAGPVRLRAGGAGREAVLQPDSAYVVSNDAQSGLQAAKIPLGETGPPAEGADAARPLPGSGVITVKILVDDDEYRPPGAWEGEVRQRIQRASEILAAHSGVRLKVVATGTWESDDAQSDFIASLDEFEREVRPYPAQVAIGFSSQYAVAQGRVHMGGTRGPLHSHIMIKERANNILEVERLELLVHELGHFLGATHSREPSSVMRPVIAPGQRRAAGSQVRFDTPNTLLMSLLGEEIRSRGVRKISDASPATLRRMAEIYSALEPATPDDPSTGHYRRLIAAAGTTPVIEDARRVLGQIVRVAKLKRQAAAASPGRPASPTAGDQLTEFYVKQAALAAKQVRRENGPRAFLLALAIAVNDPARMAKIPLAGALLGQIEGQSQQAERVAAIGEPSMHGRRDLTQHFFMSAELTALAGADFARGAGLAKELSDSHGGSGFSFRDMAANEAGVRFAEAVLGGQLSLDDVAQRFTVVGFVPPVTELPENLQADQFEERFGGAGDPRYASMVAGIGAKIAALPGYATPASP